MTLISELEIGDLGCGTVPSLESPGSRTESTGEHRKASSDTQPSTTNSEAGVQKRSGLDKFVSDIMRYRDARNEISKHPPGWATLAHRRDSYNNLHIYRDFSWANQRLACHYEWIAAKAERDVLEFDKQRTDHHRSLPGECPEYEDLMERLDKSVGQHYKVINRMQQMLQGEEVSTEISMDLLREIYPQLGEDGCAGFGALDEFRSLTPQDPDWLIWLLHTRPGRWLVRKLATDPEVQSYSAPAVTRALQIFQALVATLLLLVPPAILFLQDLNKSQAFGVMIGSTIIFCGIVSLIQRAQTRLFNTFCVGCGYVAILAAFAVARYFGVGPELDLGLVLGTL